MRKQVGIYSLSSFLNNNRALLMLVILFCVLSVLAPNFFSTHNVTTILKGASLNAIVAIGFTVIFILGQLDLSIGAVVMLCGMLAIGLQPGFGWIGSIMLSVIVGATVGLVNGLLVVKARINSFIVTLGTMTVVTGLMHLYSKGGSKAIDDFRFADWLETPLVPLLPPIGVSEPDSPWPCVFHHRRKSGNCLAGRPEARQLSHRRFYHLRIDSRDRRRTFRSRP